MTSWVCPDRIEYFPRLPLQAFQELLGGGVHKQLECRRPRMFWRGKCSGVLAFCTYPHLYVTKGHKVDEMLLKWSFRLRVFALYSSVISSVLPPGPLPLAGSVFDFYRRRGSAHCGTAGSGAFILNHLINHLINCIWSCIIPQTVDAVSATVAAAAECSS